VSFTRYAPNVVVSQTPSPGLRRVLRVDFTQVLTDRLARPDSSTQPCAFLSNYCGGTFRGLISQLDYIQNLGANAIW
jgi:hypothetical protein